MSHSPVLGRDGLVKRVSNSPIVQIGLSDGSAVLMRTPDGADYREWDRLLRNDDGSLNMERHNLREELFLIFAIVDSEGNRLLTVEDVCTDKIFDNYLLCDMDAMKHHLDESTSRLSIKARSKKSGAAS